MAAFWLCWNQSEAASRSEGGTALPEGDARFSMTSARTLPPEGGGGREQTERAMGQGQGQGQGQGYVSSSSWGLGQGHGSLRLSGVGGSRALHATHGR